MVDTNKQSIKKVANARLNLNKFLAQKEKGQNPGPSKYKMPTVFGTELYPKFLSGSGSNFCEELTFTIANISSGT